MELLRILRGLLGAQVGRAPIQPGDIFVLDDPECTENPFTTRKPHIVEVLAVKDGWVNYRRRDIALGQNESMRVRMFRLCYKKGKAQL